MRLIDETAIASTVRNWRKVAMIVGMTMSELKKSDNKAQYQGVPEIYYAQRVRKLVEKGLLESQGNLDFMQFSEVRLLSVSDENTS